MGLVQIINTDFPVACFSAILTQAGCNHFWRGLEFAVPEQGVRVKAA
jgi:hypothetical protein